MERIISKEGGRTLERGNGEKDKRGDRRNGKIIKRNKGKKRRMVG